MKTKLNWIVTFMALAWSIALSQAIGCTPATTTASKDAAARAAQCAPSIGRIAECYSRTPTDKQCILLASLELASCLATANGTTQSVRVPIEPLSCNEACTCSETGNLSCTGTTNDDCRERCSCTGDALTCHVLLRPPPGHDSVFMRQSSGANTQGKMPTS